MDSFTREQVDYIFKMLDRASRLSPLRPHKNPYVMYGFLLGFLRGLESPAPRTLPEDPPPPPLEEARGAAWEAAWRILDMTGLDLGFRICDQAEAMHQAEKEREAGLPPEEVRKVEWLKKASLSTWYLTGRVFGRGLHEDLALGTR